jgi:hypothetical protein
VQECGGTINEGAGSIRHKATTPRAFHTSAQKKLKKSSKAITNTTTMKLSGLQHIDSDIRQTRAGHFYPTWILFDESPGPRDLPCLIKRTDVGQAVCDFAIGLGVAVPIPDRFDGIAAALAGRAGPAHLLEYQITFLYMLKRSVLYQRGWLDFIMVVVERSVDSFCFRWGILDPRTKHNLLVNVKREIEVYWTNWFMFQHLVGDPYGHDFIATVRSIEQRTRFEAERFTFLEPA